MWEVTPMIVVPVALAVLTTVVLTVLPRVKGGFICILWANKGPKLA